MSSNVGPNGTACATAPPASSASSTDAVPSTIWRLLCAPWKYVCDHQGNYASLAAKDEKVMFGLRLLAGWTIFVGLGFGVLALAALLCTPQSSPGGEGGEVESWPIDIDLLLVPVWTVAVIIYAPLLRVQPELILANIAPFFPLALVSLIALKAARGLGEG